MVKSLKRMIGKPNVATLGVIPNVSEFLQLVGNIVFFVAIHVGRPHGMMEYWV
jgi:hypothetical protein